MTETEKAKAIMIGSFILYLINSLLDKSERCNATTIRLFQLLRSKTAKPEYIAYAKMSNEAWQQTITEFSDKNYHLVIFDAVEDLAFREEEACTKLYGNNFLPYCTAFALKQTRDGVENSLLKESREITKSLIKSVQKVTFDNKEK